MKQRVAIARAMAMEPQILLMDEPFAALDALTRGKMQEDLLQLWNDTRFTVLFVTHSIPEAIRIGNRILLLTPHPGRTKAEINCTGGRRRRRRRRAVVGAHSAAVVRSHGSHRRCLKNAPSTRRRRHEILHAPTRRHERFRRRRAAARLLDEALRQRHGAQVRAARAARGCVGDLRARARQPAAVPDVHGHGRARCSPASPTAKFRPRASTRCRCC